MPIWYFVPIPDLPPDVTDQSGKVGIIRYLIKEGAPVSDGTPIAEIETWRAVLQVEAAGKGYLSKTFFNRGTTVRIGEPIAIILCDGEDAPCERPKSKIQILRIKKEKPSR